VPFIHGRQGVTSASIQAFHFMFDNLGASPNVGRRFLFVKI